VHAKQNNKKWPKVMSVGDYLHNICFSESKTIKIWWVCYIGKQKCIKKTNTNI